MALLDPSDSPLASARFQDDIFSKYNSLMSGKRVQELDIILEQAKQTGITELENPYDEVRPLLQDAGLKVLQPSEELRRRFESEKEEMMLKTGLAFSREEVLDIVREFATRRSEERIREKSAKLDLQIVQEIMAVDEMDKAANLGSARVREWYGLHFPELDSLLGDPLAFCRLVADIGKRENFTEEKLKERTGLSSNKIQAILAAASQSKGGEIGDEDAEVLSSLASEVVSMSKLRDRLMRQVEKNMKKLAPNLTSVAGAAIGARLIARVGSLERLARLPSSTIQVLGAEKALFRALKSGGRPPKHGILFQHQLIHSAALWQRGKVARALASKIALAARLDFFRGELDESLQRQMQEKIEEIKKKYPKPKPREEKEKGGELRRGERERSGRRERKGEWRRHGRRGDGSFS